MTRMNNARLARVDDRQGEIRKFGDKGIKARALVRDRDNPHDANCIGVRCGADLLGYVPKNLTASLALEMDSGQNFRVEYVSERTSP